ncbi:MAG: hypothetical protein MRY74_09500 [Neomegalonema sp.]|nr:hypothetical protein [Neomegalonema sp.]
MFSGPERKARVKEKALRMGHIRLGSLPKSKKWNQVVDLLSSNGSAEEIAAASAVAAENALSSAESDPVFSQAVWLLLNAPLAARGPNYLESLHSLGLAVPDEPSLFDLTAAMSDALDRHGQALGGRSDLGEMAHMALIEAITGAVEPQLPSLFSPDPSEVRTALGRLAGGDRFAKLSRDFFARLVYRALDFFLSRELADHVGSTNRFDIDSNRREFDLALEHHCYQTARIVEEYSGGWYGKHVWRDGDFSRDDASKFAGYAFKKLNSELRRRRETG